MSSQTAITCPRALHRGWGRPLVEPMPELPRGGRACFMGSIAQTVGSQVPKATMENTVAMIEKRPKTP